MRDFEEFMRKRELINPSYRNASFTWSNMQEMPIYKRLDIFLYTNEWEQKFLQSLQDALPRLTFDHYPIVLDMIPFKWGLVPFRFRNM